MSKHLFVFLSLLLPAVALADQAPAPTWGKVVCSAVAQADAVNFAQVNPFLDNWDPNIDRNPPYVAPVGTLTCSLPVEMTNVSDGNGGVAQYLVVNLQDAPFKVPDCQVTYYDGSPTRTFPVDGDGEGYIGLAPGQSDFGPEFQDDYSGYEEDVFMVFSVSASPAITWAGEVQDQKPHVPIVTNCQLQF